MKTALLLGLLSVMASANATVYNCKPTLPGDWQGTSPEFLNARIEVVGKKINIDLKIDEMDVYKSCGKKIGRFTQKDLVKSKEGVGFAKKWMYLDQEAEDGVIFYSKTMDLPESVKINWAGSCVEGDFDFDLVCSKN